MQPKRANPSADSRVSDVVIIGAGVVGTALAWSLSRWRLSVTVIEKNTDVGMAASSRNSGVIHAGINYAPDSLRGRLCMAGRQLLMRWCDELNVPYDVCGKLVVASTEDEIPGLERLRGLGVANGVSGLEIVSAERAAELQPGIEAVAALHVPSSGIVSPYALTLALAEEAAVNGVRFHLGCEATGIRPVESGYAVDTDCGPIAGRWVINAAGIHAGRLAQTIDPDAPALYPCIGEYLILDKQVGESLRMSVYPAPPVGGAGLGVHITPTTEGNVLLGPSDAYIEDPDASWCSGATADVLLRDSRVLWPDVPTHLVIGAYAGVRSKRTPPEVGGYEDFLIRRTADHKRVVHLIGIESPGLTAAPAIAETVLGDILAAEEPLERKAESERVRRPWPTRFDDLSEPEKERRVAKDPSHGEIVCRCEGVTKAEFLHALSNPLGVKTLSGIKFRCRASMGRCSGGYCLPRMVDILQEEFGWEPDAFLLRGPESPAFAGRLIEETP